MIALQITAAIKPIKCLIDTHFKQDMLYTLKVSIEITHKG